MIEHKVYVIRCADGKLWAQAAYDTPRAAQAAIGRIMGLYWPQLAAQGYTIEPATLVTMG